MIIVDETTLTGVVRAARDNGLAVAEYLATALAVADLLELPDDTMFIPATTAAMGTPTQLTDSASLARTRDIALAAGYGQPPTLSGLA